MKCRNDAPVFSVAHFNNERSHQSPRCVITGIYVVVVRKQSITGICKTISPSTVDISFLLKQEVAEAAACSCQPTPLCLAYPRYRHILCNGASAGSSR